MSRTRTRAIFRKARQRAKNIEGAARAIALRRYGEQSLIPEYEIAADAWEEAGDLVRAQRLRVLAVGYPYGLSPPHGIFVRGVSMAYLKEMSRRAGSPYFSRSSSRFFGGDRFYGPYVGPGGVFFVQKNKSGISLKEVHPDWSISTLGRADVGVEGVREEAQLRARAVGQFYDGVSTGFLTLAQRQQKIHGRS